MTTPRIGGIYQHYHGGFYRVMYIAVLADTEDELVIYQYLDGQAPSGGSIRALSLVLWNGTVDRWHPAYAMGGTTNQKFYDNGRSAT